MEIGIAELQNQINFLQEENKALKEWKQEFSSAKQSMIRMSARLRKLCKKLDPSTENVAEMQKISIEIRDIVKDLM